MILKDDFYSIRELLFEENTISASLQLNLSHAIFKGHFPNNPVTPGVIEMEIIKEIIGVAMGKSVKMNNMSSCKFLAILNPNESPEIKIHIELAESDNQRIRINGSIADGAKMFLKIGAVYSIH